MDQIIYSVHFLQPNRLVGCREEELLDLNDIWVDSAFETRDRVRNKHGLTVRGELKVPAGSIGEILMVLRDGDENRASYHVHFDCFAGHPLIIREAALDSIQALQEEAPHV
jgi:nitrogen fixation protein NifZ